MTAMRVRQDEAGSALILALVFLSLFGLLIAAMLGQVDANIRTTLVVRTHETKVYGADAGIDYAIQALQFDDTLCPNADVGPDSWNAAPVVPVSSGVTVDVTCQTTEGNVLGIRGHAVITTEPKGSGETSIDTGSGTTPRVIEGPVYVAGDLTLAKPLDVKGAFFTQASPCQATIPGLTVTPAPFTKKCSTAAVPDESHKLPEFPTGGVQSPSGDGLTPCRTFSPGVYKTVPDLAPKNFFASGMYYFEDINLWQIDEELFGGLPRPDDGEPTSLTETPCVGVDPGTGQGVLFVFGGTSSMQVVNNGHVELFSANQVASGTGDAGYSIRAVLPADSDTTLGGDVRWKTSTAATILKVDGGNTRDFAVHGIVYAPNNVVDLFATGGDVSALLQSGAKVKRLVLDRSESGLGLGVSTKKGSGRRKITIVSKATEPGSRTVEARAVIQIENDAARTVTVVSQSVQ